MSSKKDEEVLFTECKESVDDVFGWKVVIFLPQNSFWKVFIMLTVALSFFITTLKVFYLNSTKLISVLEIICDCIYCMDVLCATLHFSLRKTRQLRQGKNRLFFFLVVDYVSLIPLNIIHEYLIFKEGAKPSNLNYILRANAILRSYQIPLGFSDIKQTVYRIKNYYILVFIEVIVYYGLLMHFFSCFLYLYFDENQKKQCLNQFGYCVAENNLLTFGLMDHNFIAPFSHFPLTEYFFLLSAEFLFGFIFAFGYVTPLLIYVSLTFLKEFFEYSSRQKQLNLSIHNSIEDPVLKEKITHYYHYAWTYGKGDNLPEILKIFPLSFKKTIFCDIHWDAFRHSELLQSLSNGCKRSLALSMTTEFVLPNTTIFKKDETKTFFIYLETGLLQVMAEENSESPILNLSDGAVLGEVSFFVQTESKAILRTGMFSVVHILKFTDLFRVLLHYPKDMKKISHKMKLRLKVARAVYKNKTEICPLFLNEMDYILSELTSVKWLKQQFRAIVNLKKAEEMKMQSEGSEILANYHRHIQSLETQLQHTSIYLSLLSIKDEVGKANNAVCLKASFPWFLDPDCHFLVSWKILINILSLVVVVLYPVFLGWFPIVPTWFFNISILINFMYIIDVFVQLATAIKIKNIVTHNFTGVISHRLSSFIFYIDILAALPLYLLSYFNEKFQGPFKLNLLLCNALMKSYKLINIMNKLSYSSKPGIFYLASIKYVLITYFSIYWSAALFNLLEMECVLYDCGEREWFKKDSVKKGEHYGNIVSVFVALYMVIDIPYKNIHSEKFASFVSYFLLYIVSNFLYYVWQGECIACYVLENSQKLEYKNLQVHVQGFMKKYNVSEMIKNRVMNALEFQWSYDNGNYITQKRRIFDDFSTDLREEIDRKMSIPILSKSRLFKFEDNEFLVDLCRRAKHLAVPAGSLLLPFKTQTMAIYVVHKGYIQVNSFLAGDLHLNISTPLLFKTGDTFPVLMALSQIPASITAMTVTDCEMLILDLEDVVTTMLNHGVLPDVVKALKEIDLTPLQSARLGLTRIKHNLEFNALSYRAVFIRLKCLGKLLKCVLKKKGINSNCRLYLLWEVTRNLLIFFNLIAWPIVFGCCSKCAKKLNVIYTLLVFDCLSSLVDFYLRLHINYYNKLGIYVTHPLATFSHYLKSSFLLDLVSFVPNFHIIYLLTINVLNFNEPIIITHMLMRSLSLYRIAGLFSYVENNLKKLVSFTKLSKCFFFGLLLVHYYVNFKVYFYIQGKRKPEFSFSLEKEIVPSKSYEYYFYEFSLIVSMLLNGMVFFDCFNVYNLISITIFRTLALLCQTYIFSVLTLSITTANENFTLYQYYLRSFVKYLKNEKADEKISSQAIKYFEFKWQKSKGIDIKKIFSRFPQTLDEDVMFPLYKDTLSATRCLSGANVAFFRALSRNVEMINLMKASEIIFKKQVQDDIFFVLKGKCYVTEVSKTLVKGAIIGDIRHRGFMKHTIVALTHVDLLRIPSKLFFLILQNFYDTKKAFELEVAEADDFIESVYAKPESALIEIESVIKQENLDESEFKPAEINLEDTVIRPLKVNSFKFFLKSDSLTLKMFNLLFFIDAYITVLILPIFLGITLLSWWAFVIIYVLDIIWIAKIILTTRTALLQSKTGNYLYKKNVIYKEYLHKFDGMILHILSVLPVEIILVACYKNALFTEHCHKMYYCYCNRLLRIPYIHYYIQSKMKELLANVYLKLLNIIVFGFALINLFVCFNLILRRNKEFDNEKCHWEIYRSQLDNLQKSYFFVLNHYVNGGIPVCLAETPLEICFYLLIELWSMVSKAVIVNQILVIILVTQHSKSTLLLKLQQLEKYLTIRPVSSPLFQKMQKYCCNLLNSYKEEAHPSFLKEVPPFIRMKIMEDIYIHNLENCYLFQGIENFFLRQLAMRLERFIFFPGDYIVEKGDVDQNMYFIHKGEVKCLELDMKYPVLERTVDLIITGESFGIMQGILFSCPHLNSYRAKVLTDVLVLNYYKWGDLRTAFPDITEGIYKKFKRTDPTNHMLN